MNSKIAIFLVLVLTLLGVPSARPAPVECAMPQSAVKMQGGCEKGCCTNMACCVKRTQEEPQPVPAQAPQRETTSLVAVLPRLISLLYELPPIAREFVILAEAAEPHALSPRVASCIWLI